MSYAGDLAKDRAKYLRQRNEVMSALARMCERPSPQARVDALRLLKKIEGSDPIVNAVERLSG